MPDAQGLDQTATIVALEDLATAYGLVLTVLPWDLPDEPLRLWIQGPA